MSRSAGRRGSSRWIELCRAGWGAALLIAPEHVLTRVHHVRIDKSSLAVARVLGARHIAQAALSGLRPSPEVLAMGVWVDTVHAATAVGLAAVDRARARAGLTDTAVAAVWAGAGYRDLSTGRVPPPHHDRRRDAMARFVLRRAPLGKPLLRHAERARQRWPEGT